MPDQSHPAPGDAPPPAPSQDHTSSNTVVVPQTTTTKPLSPPDEKRQRIRVKNRRKMYLDKHPSYFTSPDLEIVGKHPPPPLFNSS